MPSLYLLMKHLNIDVPIIMQKYNINLLFIHLYLYSDLKPHKNRFLHQTYASYSANSRNIKNKPHDKLLVEKFTFLGGIS